MSALTRRDFTWLSASAGILAIAPLGRCAFGQAAGKVVVIGGGPGGVTVANRLKAANAAIDVTLIEPKQKYTTCFYSNLYLGGFRSFQSITHNYEAVRKRGVNVVTDKAIAVDAVAKTVTLERGGAALPYDRLVIAPGIDIKFDSVEGYSAEAAEIMPHAWQGGPQTWLLKQKLLALSDGEVVIMTVPGNPYRCPPGPYERACMIAHFLKTRKPKSKLLLFDAKKTVSKQAVFEEAFAEFYKGIVEFNLTNEIDDYAVQRVDPKTGDVFLKSGRSERAALANIIPAQKAGGIAATAGVTEGDWCPVHPENFTSTKVKDVYVLGDAAIAADMPKSAFTAVSQASVVADDIIADLSSKPRAAGKYRNTCWSMLSPENSVKIGGDYVPATKDGKAFLEVHEPFVSKPGESGDLRRETYNESAGWYASLVADLYGTDPNAAEPTETAEPAAKPAAAAPAPKR